MMGVLPWTVQQPMTPMKQITEQADTDNQVLVMLIDKYLEMCEGPELVDSKRKLVKVSE